MNKFLSKVEMIPEAGCWIWTGCLATNGIRYGMLRRKCATGKVKTFLAHRYSYELFKGPIPKRMHVLHRCDVRECVNPEHLFIGTNADNIEDSMRKGRRKGVPRNRPTGLVYAPMSNAGRAAHMTIKPPQRLEIIELVESGLTQTAVAKMYGVQQSCVSRIVSRGRKW